VPSSPTLPFLGMDTYLDECIYSDGENSRRDRRISGTGHTSAGSYEPLLAAFAKASTSSASPEPGIDNRPPRPPPRNPLRVLHGSQPGSRLGTPALDLDNKELTTNHKRESWESSESAESAHYDHRLNPGLLRRARAGSAGASTSDLRDDEDYSRPVLTVRNTSSVHSHP